MRAVVRKVIDEKIVENLALEYKLDKSIVSALLMRDVEPKDFLTFLNPSIFDLTPINELTGLKEVAERIRLAISRKEKIVIYGDYDCDGICSTAILYGFLKSSDADVKYFLPNRFKHGYGLSVVGLEYIAENYFPDLIITVDCGISSIKEIEYACEDLGIDIVVTDHHTPATQLPECLFFDPKTSEDSKKKNFYQMCGAGIVLRLIEGLSDIDTMQKYIDIAALATVGDVVSLTGDNRIIAKLGIDKINSGKVCKGLEKLLVALSITENITSSDLAFNVVPKLNAMGRMADAKEVVELFFETDTFILDALIGKILEANINRQQFTEDVYIDCIEKIKKEGKQFKKGIVLWSKVWHEGVLGIVAARLAEQFLRPVVLLTSNENGAYKGSARSTDNIDLFSSISAASDFVLGFGGHKGACGLSVAEEKLFAFEQTFCDKLGENRQNEEFYAIEKYDFKRDNFPALGEVESFLQFAPFGVGNPNIKFLIEYCECDFLQISDKPHLKYAPNKDCQVIAFNWLNAVKLLNSKIRKGFLLEFEKKVFKNNAYAQGIVDKIAFGKTIFDNESEELYFAEYAKQLFWSGKPKYNVEEITKDGLLFLAKKNIFGTVFLCNLEKTFNDLCRFFDEADVNIEKSVQTTSKNNLNSLILSPSIADDLTLYKNIVFVDKPIEMSAVNQLKIAENAEVFYCNHYDNSKELRDNFSDYSALANIFLEIKKQVLVKTYKNLDLLCLTISKNSSISISKVYFAFYVFFDLKIIKFSNDKTIYIDSSVTNKLENSAFYSKYLKLIEL